MDNQPPARSPRYGPAYRNASASGSPGGVRRSGEYWVGEHWVRVPPEASERAEWAASASEASSSPTVRFPAPSSPATPFHRPQPNSPSSEHPATPAPAAPTEATHPLRLLGMALREGVQVLIPALLLAALIHGFLAQATVVYGQSMEPSLHEKERLIIDKISYRLRAPARDDIVVLDLPEMDEKLVKRVVGLPGETVEIRDGLVYINGVALDESFPHGFLEQTMSPLRLGPLQYFVLGDNRGNSNDSRSFGYVHRESIVGRVWLRYWPLPAFGKFP